MLYHASRTSGLTVLLPRPSTHGTAYVYAARSRATALLFGAPKDDFDLLMDETDGIPAVWECYPDALKKAYQGKSCSLYTLKEDGFASEQTGWDAEMVCEGPAAVLFEERISDLYAALLCLQQQGDCVVHLYSEEEAYQHFLRDELRERVTAFGLSAEQMAGDERFALYFKHLLEK